MSRITGLALLCASTFSLGTAHPAVGQATLQSSRQQSATPVSAILYDNFNEKFLSPLKWSTVSACYADNGLELECAREIHDGRLHMAHRNFGPGTNNLGFSFGDVSVSFSNPSSIKSITSDIVVRSIEEAGCAANPQLGGAVHIDATFFNTGTGNSSDDVGGHIGIGRLYTDPAGQLTAFGQISQGGNYYATFPLGTVTEGTPVTATLSWDQSQHQFLAAWTNDITHVTTQVNMPYTFSDTTPPTNPSKVLTLNTFPSYCTANVTWVFIDAYFDNVFVVE